MGSNGTSPRRVIGHMVVRNELDRYLKHTLGWLRQLVDTLVVYDDNSTDGTAGYLQETCVPLAVRPPAVPSFMNDEGKFRQAAWHAMENLAHPEPGDWVLVVDADEFLVAQDPSTAYSRVRHLLTTEIDRAATHGKTAVTFQVAEVYDPKPTQIRIDGFWGTILAPRLVAWQPNARFRPKTQGGGAVPAIAPGTDQIATDLALLHYGYARSVDRHTRYDRYNGTAGHNPRHVQSINGRPELRPWCGMQVPHPMKATP